MFCKFLRSSLKTVHRTVFTPYGVALSSNLSSDKQKKHNGNYPLCFFSWLGWRDFLLEICKTEGKNEIMFCKFLRSSLKTVRRTVFTPDGVALSSNLSLTASQVKQKEQVKTCSFCLAGVERFELPDDGVRVRSLTAWRHPNFSLLKYNSKFFSKIQLF